ncbi:MAG: class I SAM-dependent methyltransferase [Anaerolineae bacterium]|nr:class I SAM-dependent methyltransferase [Anaerolineae bacterium]
MNQNIFLAQWLEEEQKPFAGWDFSYLHGRMFEEKPPWSYIDRAATLMQQAASVLDIDTGGGEKLLSLREHWPAQVVATEGYPPNIELAAERLQPLGVSVIPLESSESIQMPFADSAFELVLNRHGAFNPAECARVLAPGGTFLTKQVHGLWAQDLLAIFGATPPWPDATPARYVPWLERCGLTLVDVQDWQGELRFTDVAAIVYYLKAVPWLVPNFSVNTHQAQLLGLQARLDAGESLAFEARTYLIEARKP